jgi:hypothetical protein
MKRFIAGSLALAIAALTCEFLSPALAADDYVEKKNFHIKLPGANDNNRTTATDVHIKFFGKPEDKGTTGGWTTSQVEGNTLNLSGGSIAPGTDFDLNVRIPGSPNGGPIIQSIDWTTVDSNGDEHVFLSQTAAQNLGRKGQNGFTNFEYFDFSDPNNGHFFILNPTDNGVQLQYLLADFQIFKNLPAGNLSGDPFTNTTGGSLIFSNPALTIAPGQIIDIPLGAVSSGTYSLATIGALTVTDVVFGGSDVYATSQGFLQTFGVPEPETYALMLAGLGLLVFVARRRKMKAT